MRLFTFGVSEYVVVGSRRPGDRYRPGVTVGEPAGMIYFRSPRNYHFPKRFPEVLRQERVQYWVQARIGVRQTMTDNLHDDADGRNLVIVNTLQHQYNLKPQRKFSQQSTGNRLGFSKMVNTRPVNP